MCSSIALLLGGLALVAVSGIVLSGQIERLAQRLRFSAGLLGIVAALGADAPEISSAVSALMSGDRDVGVGVVLGSNVYNLAVLLGLSAVVARKGVRIGKRGLWLNGGVALAVTALTTLLVARLLSGWLTFALTLSLLVPYVVASSLHASQIESLPLPPAFRRFLCRAVTNVERDVRRDKTPKRGRALDALSLVPALVSVVLGSFAMVHAALNLGHRWGFPSGVVGVIVLAVLTGVPNTLAALTLARHGRGTAVLSEALNSNSVNVVFGLCLPAVVIGSSAPSTSGVIAVAALGAVTILALALATRQGGLRRADGALLLTVYAGFVALVVATGPRRTRGQPPSTNSAPLSASTACPKPGRSGRVRARPPAPWVNDHRLTPPTDHHIVSHVNGHSGFIRRCGSLASSSSATGR